MFSQSQSIGHDRQAPDTDLKIQAPAGHPSGTCYAPGTHDLNLLHM